ncbi:MAG: SCO family protein [bacterium]
MMTKTHKLINLMVVALMVSTGCHTSEPSFKTTVIEGLIPPSDFTLTDQNGEPFTLSEHKGEVVLLFFGYTYCPDVCPLTLSTWKKVENALKEDGNKVKFVYVTVDPERDTRGKMRQHLSIFSPDFIGLTGTLEELLPVYSAYGVYREKVKISDSAAGYLVNHTTRMFVFDRQGKLRLGIPYDAPVEDIVHDIRLLLRN